MLHTTLTLYKKFFTSLIVGLLTMSLFVSVAHASDDLLEIDDAFKLQTPLIEDQKVIIQWDIAQDYHLYKDKLSVSTESTAFEAPIYSAAKLVDDPLFGKTEVYEKSARISLPFQNASDAVITTTLTLKYQGCADKIGVCYPPQTRTVKVDLPRSQAVDPSGLSALNNFFMQDSGQPELLDADEAFKFSEQINASGQLELSWNIAHDYHLYQDKIKVTLLNGDASVGELQLPAAEQIDDPLFGKTMVYHGMITGSLPFKSLASPATLQIEFQGCSAAAGVCYPPIKKQISVNPTDIQTQSLNGSALNSNSATNNTTSPSDGLSESDQIADTLKNSSIWIVIATFFIFG
jgi:thiol:disulfide interchange protein DsbD